MKFLALLDKLFLIVVVSGFVGYIGFMLVAYLQLGFRLF